MKYPAFWLLIILLLSFSLSKAAEGSDDHLLDVTAHNVTLNSETKSVKLSGHVNLSIGNLKLTCEDALALPSQGVVLISSPLTLTYRHLVLTGMGAHINTKLSQIEVESPSILLPSNSVATTLFAKRLRCDRYGCNLVDARGTMCPHRPHGYEIMAENVRLHQSGDLDLYRPSIVVSGHRLLTLPWIRLRPQSKPGFLTPRLGYDRSAGFIFGPRGHIPLVGDYHLDGHIAARTLQGFETSTAINGEHLSLKLDHIFDAPQNTAHLSGYFSPPLKNVGLVLDLNYATDMSIVDALIFDPTKRAVTHLANRLLVSTYTTGFTIESQMTYLQPIRGTSVNVLTPTTSIGVTISPLLLNSPIWAILNLGFDRRSLASVDFSDLNGRLAPSHSRIIASPRLLVPVRLGFFSASIEASTLHELWLPDGVHQRRSLNIAAAGATLSLPLRGAPFGFRHILTPAVSYRIIPWKHGRSPDWTVDSLDAASLGHGVELSVNNSFGGTALSPKLNLSITERLDLGGFGRKTRAAYWHFKSSLGPTWLHMDVETSWDHEQRAPSYAGIALSSFDSKGAGFMLGGNWYGPGQGAHFDTGVKIVLKPWMTNYLDMEAVNLLELFNSVSLALTRYMKISGGVKVGVHPDLRLHAIWYGVSLGSGCGCISLGLNASHRLDSAIPDVMAVINVGERKVR